MLSHFYYSYILYILQYICHLYIKRHLYYSHKIASIKLLKGTKEYKNLFLQPNNLFKKITKLKKLAKNNFAKVLKNGWKN